MVVSRGWKVGKMDGEMLVKKYTALEILCRAGPTADNTVSSTASTRVNLTFFYSYHTYKIITKEQKGMPEVPRMEEASKKPRPPARPPARRMRPG